MASRLLRIGEIAAQAGVSVDTVRHYERRGLLPAPDRAANGYRLYPASMLRRLAVIQNALRCGFSLRELGAFFQRRQQNDPPCRDVRVAAGHKLERLDEEIRALAALRKTMRMVLADWDERLAATSEGNAAALLDSLSSAALSRSKNTQRPSVRRPQRRKDA